MQPLNTRSIRNKFGLEITIVFALSLGASAVYSVISIIYRLTSEVPLSQQTATINRPLSEQAIFDLIYQILGIVFDLAPVALALYLLWSIPTKSQNPFQAIGFNFSKPKLDFGIPLLLSAVIGIPGLALYLISRQLGINTQIIPTALDEHWWTVPILILVALRAALQEEILVVGYLFDRLRAMQFGSVAIILSTSLLRASYHLYQGFGMFIGNFVMGLAFGWIYQKYGRVMPLVITHFVLDVASFVGYPLALSWFPELF